MPFLPPHKSLNFLHRRIFTSLWPIHSRCPIASANSYLFLYIVPFYDGYMRQFAWLALALICGCASQKPWDFRRPETPLEFLSSGEFAYYHDRRGGSNFFRGYLFVSQDGSDMVISRNLNLKDGREENFVFTVKAGEDGLPVAGDIQGDFNTLEFQQALPDFLNHAGQFLRTRDRYDIMGEMEDAWENYKLTYRFNKVLPFFRFSSVVIKGNKTAGSYTLAYGGIIGAGEFDMFMKALPVSREQSPARNTAIPKKTEGPVSFGGLAAVLDGNWSYNESLGFPGYWLSVDSPRDSQLSVERGNLEVFGLGTDNAYLFFRYLVLAARGSIDVESVRVSRVSVSRTAGKPAPAFQLECYLWDQGLKNYQRALLVPEAGEFYMVNFSSQADFYDSNRSYYEKIFRSLSLP